MPPRPPQLAIDGLEPKPNYSPPRSGGRSATFRFCATNQRLHILHEGIWASVWYSAIRHLVPHLDEHRLELIFDEDPPYALHGEWMPCLAVVLTAALAEQRGLEAMSGVVRTPA